MTRADPPAGRKRVRVPWGHDCHTGEETVTPPAMQDLSSDRFILRRQLFRAYRGWLAQLVKEQGDRMPGRSRMIEHLRCWDLRFSDGQTPAQATLLLEEVPIAMMAALGRVCRDRRININIRMVLARDYRHYRKLAREMVEVGTTIGQELRKHKEEKVMAALRKEQEPARPEEEKKSEMRRTWWQRVQREWWLFRAWLGCRFPARKLEELAELAHAGREEDLMERFYELGGTVTKIKEPSPPWTEMGDTWNEVDGEIWNVEPCYHGGRMIYVGNIFKDPVIRGKENPYFQPGWRPATTR